MSLLAQDKSIVVPGEVLAEGMDFLPSFGTYRKDEKIMANRLGLLMVDGKVLKTIPLAGRYLPKRNDVIIAKVIDIMPSGWRVEFNSAWTAVLSLKEASFSFIQKSDDLTKFFNIDDHLICKIVQVTSQNLVDVSCKGPGLRKLRGGRIIKVNTNKVPRIIGKKGSMVSMIKTATNCMILVGQNGLVWIMGEPANEIIAVNTVKKIEEESHNSGLTVRIREYLEKMTGKKVEEAVPEIENNGE